MEKEYILNKIKESGVDITRVLEFFGVDIHPNSKKILCPFHDDRVPSMLLNNDDTAHCFACDIHLDIVQMYAALKYKDLENGRFIWESDDIADIIADIVKDLGLELSIDLDSRCINNEQEFYFAQLKENWLDTVPDSLYQRNYPMADFPYSSVKLDAKSIYIYRDPLSKEPLAVKVRYEAYFGEYQEEVLYLKKSDDYVEHIRTTPDKPIKRKSFRFYDIKEGKIVKAPLPEEKKEIIYNGDRVLEVSEDIHKRHSTWIWFVEGEKDVETLKEYGFIGCSLMKGAGSKWSEKYNSIFKGCRVIIASDWDTAGLEYEETLFKALLHAKYGEKSAETDDEKYCTIGLKKLNKKFYEINNMPEKSDITDLIEKWKHDGLTKKEIIGKLNEIIERSIDYKDSRSVSEDDRGMCIGGKRIADFHIVDAVNIISTDASNSDMIQLTIQGIGMCNKKQHTRIGNVHEIFGSPDAFNKTFSVMDCTFLGSKDELFQTKKFILNYKIFHDRFMYSANGMYKHQDEEWITVTPDGTLKKDGAFDKDIFSSNSVTYNDLCKVNVPEAKEINRVVPALLNFNVKEVVYNVLGEVGCKLLNSRYRELGIKNHLFSLNGTKGAGKTETSVKVIAALTNNSTRGEYNLTGQSNFTFLKNVSSNNIGGMILQELKLGKMTDYDKNKWSEIFRNNYDRAKSQRGTKDQELNQYDQSNPIITTGEEGIGEESALYERFNIIFMTTEKRSSDSMCEENFRLLCDNQRVLNGIGKQMLIDIMNLTDKEIMDKRHDIERQIRCKGLDKKGFVDRVLNNTVNVIHGFVTLSDTLKRLDYNGQIDLDEAFDTIISNFLENILRVSDDSIANDDYQNMLIQFQKALDNDYNDKVVGAASNAYYVYENSLWIAPSKVRTVIANFVQDSKQNTIVLSDGEFRKNLVSAGYISEDIGMRKKFNHAQVKGWYYKVVVQKMRNLGLGFIDELVESRQVKGNQDIDNPQDFFNCNNHSKTGQSSTIQLF